MSLATSTAALMRRYHLLPNFHTPRPRAANTITAVTIPASAPEDLGSRDCATGGGKIGAGIAGGGTCAIGAGAGRLTRSPAGVATGGGGGGAEGTAEAERACIGFGDITISGAGATSG